MLLESLLPFPQWLAVSLRLWEGKKGKDVMETNSSTEDVPISISLYCSKIDTNCHNESERVVLGKWGPLFCTMGSNIGQRSWQWYRTMTVSHCVSWHQQRWQFLMSLMRATAWVILPAHKQEQLQTQRIFGCQTGSEAILFRIKVTEYTQKTPC